MGCRPPCFGRTKGAQSETARTSRVYKRGFELGAPTVRRDFYLQKYQKTKYRSTPKKRNASVFFLVFCLIFVGLAEENMGQRLPKNADIINNRGYGSYKFIKSYFYNNQNGFDVIDELGNRTKAKGKRQGIAELGSNILNLYVSANEIEGILTSGGYNQLRNLRKSWREAGFIDSEKDRYVVDYDTLGSCYHFVYHI